MCQREIDGKGVKEGGERKGKRERKGDRETEREGGEGEKKKKGCACVHTSHLIKVSESN